MLTHFIKLITIALAGTVLTACSQSHSEPMTKASKYCEPGDAPAILMVTGANTDGEKFTEYGDALRASGLYEHYEGYYQAIGDPAQTLEGEWAEEEFTVLARFPCRAALDGFWFSDEYTQLKKLRENAGPVRAVIYEELSPPERIEWSD